MIGNPAKAKLLVFAVFLLGAVTGAVGLNLYQSRTDLEASPEKTSRQQVQRVQDLLGLTAEQRQQWKGIVEESNPEFNKLREENRKLTAPNQAKFDALFEKTRSKIRAILTDKQKKTYEEFNENQRRRMSRSRQNQSPNPSQKQNQK